MTQPSIPRQALALIGWLAICFAASTTSTLISIDGWHESLHKPSWNPPSWIFAPAWTLLYVLMAVSAWLVWRDGSWRMQSKALSLFMMQWTLNLLWTPLFFGMHRPDWALLDILALWLMILATLLAFWRVRRLAGALLLPYLAWVTFATALNFMIWCLNP